MPSSSLSALSSSDSNQSSRSAGNAGKASDSSSKLPFNQLLASNLSEPRASKSGASESADTTSASVSGAELEGAENTHLANPEGGKKLPLSGKDLPSSPLSDANAELAAEEALGADDALVNWQQVQIDWSRTQLNSAGSAVGDVMADASKAQLTADELLLQQEKLLQSGNQAKANVLAATASAQNSGSTGFAAAMQGAMAPGEGVAIAPGQQMLAQQLKGEQSESVSNDADFTELASLSQLKNTLSAGAANSARAPLTLTMNQSLVDNPAWGQAMAARIGMMVNNGVHTATMQLHPAELGGIHIQLSIQGDNTSVQFQTQNGETSDLIEKMLPRLNSSLEQQGLRLDEVKVTHNPNLGNGAAANGNQQFAGQSAGQGDAAGRGGNGDALGRDDELLINTEVQIDPGSKLAVDYYA
ncbi:flagellar hook-length control protein FliK [Zhongshania borealis]|uniref:Flagellar hook-length control protein-like C-terminal domain-containing protein n=1 Tax=Zhongshania borealis TaxID=889488 RepID=A0ABP7W709_9GAMM